jgi:predicted ATPase
VGEIAGELALHFERGRDYQRAVRYRQSAAEQALRRSAYHEAIVHCRQGLELLAALPDTSERIQHELTLLMTLGPVLMATQGWAAAEVTQYYTRARALCAQLGNIPQLVAVLWNLWAFHLVRSELRTAQTLAEECLQIAEQTADAGLLLEAYHAVGSCSMWRGEFARARAEMEQGITLYQPQLHHALAAVYGGFDPGMGCLSCAAEVLWFLGYPDQALTRSQEALRLAHELDHCFSLVYALSFATWLHLYRGEGRIAQERAEALIALASEHGFALYGAQGTIQRGEALIAQGQWEEGVAQSQQGLEAFVGDLMRPHHLALLAEGYRGAGQVEKGLAAVAEALRLVDKNDERLYEAEVYRIKGELVLQSGVRRPTSEGTHRPKASVHTRESEAEQCFVKAIDIARKQQAKSLELRAVMSLSRLWQQQRKTAEARQMLAEIYGWFTEGFGTKDLQEAKTLLSDLSANSLSK